MRITNYITSIFRRRDSVLSEQISCQSWAWDVCEAARPFGQVVWLNITELLTNLINDVTFSDRSGNALLFAQFKDFVNRYGEKVLIRLFDEGAVVIGYDSLGFRVLKDREYIQESNSDDTVIRPVDQSVSVYVMKSSAFETRGMSDRQLCSPYIEYIDNALNASNTCSARLGALVVGSPSQSGAIPTATVLTKEQKEDVEKNLSNEYGSLRRQKQFMILPRSMNFQTISLSGLDQRTADKVRAAILVICDRIKVPANQVAFVDAMSSKTLSNGTELREGDFSKYQSFERLLNRTFIRMANDAGLKVDYTIYNKPQRLTE